MDADAPETKLFCGTCGCMLTDGNFVIINGVLYCFRCYAARNAAINLN